MHNGCSIAGAAAADHPLVQAITAGDVPAHSIVLATSLDRYTRACGTLERLLEAAEAKGVRLVVLLPDSNLVAALLQHEEGYAAAALGSEACEALRDTAGGGATLRELEEHAAANYRLVQSAASSAPVAVPVLLNGCAPGALAASRAAEGQAAAFAAGRQASFSDALDARAVDGQQAGIAAFKAAAAGNSSGQRGVSAQQEAALVPGAQAAAAGGGRPGLDFAVASSSCSRSWECITCSCGPGGSDPACRCSCQPCRHAREGLCGCPAACDAGGECSCPPACSCLCLHCHKAGGGQEECQPCLGPGCSKLSCRPSAQFCHESCYAAFCEQEGVAPDRCPLGDSCCAPGGPGLLPGGVVFGARWCRACFSADKNATQTAKRRAAAPAPADEGGPSKKRQPPAPENKAVSRAAAAATATVCWLGCRGSARVPGVCPSPPLRQCPGAACCSPGSIGRTQRGRRRWWPAPRRGCLCSGARSPS